MRVRSISGPGDPVDVMNGTFGKGTFEAVGERSFTTGNITFLPNGFQIRNAPSAHRVRSYATLIKDLSH